MIVVLLKRHLALSVPTREDATTMSIIAYCGGGSILVNAHVLELASAPICFFGVRMENTGAVLGPVDTKYYFSVHSTFRTHELGTSGAA